jgi:MGT family glycosyltransferase
MATMAFFAPAGAGHVNPTLGLAAELVRRGHRVIYSTTSAFEERAAETGAEVVPFTSSWESLDRGRVPQMHGKELIRAMGLLLDETKAVLPQISRGERPDLVVHDGTMCWWGRIMARRWQVPSVETWPNLVSNEHWSMQTKYTTFNPMSLRTIRMLIRIAGFLRGEGFPDVGRSCGARAPRSGW